MILLLYKSESIQIEIHRNRTPDEEETSLQKLYSWKVLKNNIQGHQGLNYQHA